MAGFALMMVLDIALVNYFHRNHLFNMAYP